MNSEETWQNFKKYRRKVSHHYLYSKICAKYSNAHESFECYLSYFIRLYSATKAILGDFPSSHGDSHSSSRPVRQYSGFQRWTSSAYWHNKLGIMLVCLFYTAVNIFLFIRGSKGSWEEFEIVSILTRGTGTWKCYLALSLWRRVTAVTLSTLIHDPLDTTSNQCIFMIFK